MFPKMRGARGGRRGHSISRGAGPLAGWSWPGCGRRTLQTPNLSMGRFPESPRPRPQHPVSSPSGKISTKKCTQVGKNPTELLGGHPDVGIPLGLDARGLRPRPQPVPGAAPWGPFPAAGQEGGPCNIPLGCSNPPYLTTEIFFAGCLLPRAGISVPVAMATWASPWEPARDGESCKHKTGQKQALPCPLPGTEPRLGVPTGVRGAEHPRVPAPGLLSPLFRRERVRCGMGGRGGCVPTAALSVPLQL